MCFLDMTNFTSITMVISRKVMFLLCYDATVKSKTFWRIKKTSDNKILLHINKLKNLWEDKCKWLNLVPQFLKKCRLFRFYIFNFDPPVRHTSTPKISSVRCMNLWDIICEIQKHLWYHMWNKWMPEISVHI